MSSSRNGRASILSFDTFTTNGKIPVTAYTTKSYNVMTIEDECLYSQKKIYLKAFATFDIEDTTVVPDDTARKPYAFLYHWQMCIDGTVVFGRRWESYMELLQKIKAHLNLGERKKMVIYVHYLSHEFAFIRSFFDWEDVFARGEHKIMRASIDGFEFRCSYFLSNESLEKFTEHQGAVYRKVKSDTFDELNGIEYDYKKYRNPDTELTDDELAYCYNDVMGLWEAVSNLLKDDTLHTIPLTSTGYVRRDVRNAVKGRKYSNYIRTLALNLEQYELCKEAFRGGDTHAQHKSIGEIWENVDSFDFSSSYPYVIMSRLFPSGPFIAVGADQFVRYYKQGYAMIFRLRLMGVNMKNYRDMPYVPKSHCRNLSKNYLYDNGRIIKADELEITVTEIDYRIICDIYEFDSQQVRDLYIAPKAYLPEGIRKTTLEYFEKKTLLKGVKGKEQEYMKSKNKLNAIFGMMVTDILQDNWIWEDGELKSVPVDEAEAMESHYKSYKLFLAYQWGIWITAYARERLHESRRLFNYETIYNDTDSDKVPEGYRDVVEEYNNKVMKEIMACPIIPVAVDAKGIRHYMGTLDYEGTYDKFITWGAKKYATMKDGKIEITVAGLSKKLGAEQLEKDGFEAFSPGWQVSPSGNLTAYYGVEAPHEITDGGCTFLTGSYVALIESSYILNITPDLSKLTGNKYFNKTLKRLVDNS